MGTRTGTRDRMVRSAGALLARRGVAGTTVAEVLRDSEGPRGSVGHHFPGGRTELLVEALRRVGDHVTQLLHDGARTGSAEEVFLDICAHYLAAASADDRAGCPIGAAAQESHHDPALGPVVAEIVTEWRAELAGALVGDGHGPGAADRLALVAISALEGAVMLARVTRDTAPIAAVVDHVAPLLGAVSHQ